MINAHCVNNGLLNSRDNTVRDCLTIIAAAAEVQSTLKDSYRVSEELTVAVHQMKD